MLGEAGAAVHLHGVGTDVETPVGEKRFHHRRHQRHVVAALLADVFVGAGVAEITVQSGPGHEGAATLDDGAGVHQHAPHVGVDNDRVGRAVGILGAGERATLQPILGESGGGLIGGFGLGDALQADA